jgi:carbamate kinase
MEQSERSSSPSAATASSPTPQHQSVEDQYLARPRPTTTSPAWSRRLDVAITHGNGPQVGFILRRSELARHELHEVPLDVCGADTQGAIGYELQQNLATTSAGAGSTGRVTVVTQVEVDPDDPPSTSRRSRSARS